jgi:inner membrane protein
VVKHATAISVLAANTPDCDTVTYFYGQWFGPGGAECYFDYHRGITHAIVATPVMALLPLLLVRLMFRRDAMPWWRAWIVSIVGVASHWLLDLTNAYGIRLWLPWSADWPALDIANVVDAWIWAVLIVSVLWPMLARLVGSEMGAAKKGFIGRGWAVFGLAFVLCFNTARWFLHKRAVAVQEGRMYQSELPRRVFAFPTALNPLVWRGVVETEGAWVTQTVDLADEDQSRDLRVLHKAAPSAAIQAARRTSAFQVMERFSRALLWRATPSEEFEGGARVEAVDLRFGFTATAVVDGAGRVQRAWFRF